MSEILRTLSHTPLWVYAVFAALMILGYSQTRNRIVSAKRALMMPIVMLCFSFYGVVSSFGLGSAVATWIAGVLISTLIGSRLNLIVKTSPNLFLTKDSLLPLILMTAIFILKYIIGYGTARGLEIIHNPIFIYICGFAFGALSGVFLGMILNLAAKTRL